MEKSWTKWSDKEIEKLTIVYPTFNWKQLSLEFTGKSRGSIRRKANLLGIRKENLSLLYRVHRRNSRFFSEINPITSYYAGLLAADGCISDNGSVSLSLHNNDVTYLEKFKLALEYDGKITKSKTEEISVLRICDRGIIGDLEENFNLHARKTKNLEPPFITDNICIRAFIIGYIDGDGCISYMKGRHVKKYISLSLMGTKSLLTWVTSFFDKEFPPSYWKSAKIRPRSNTDMWEYCIKGKRAASIIRDFSSIDVPKFERKWSKINNCDSNGILLTKKEI
jgi:hypothetical protein